MIDYFALALTHGLILLALIRIAGKPELDLEPGLESKRKRGRPNARSNAPVAEDDTANSDRHQGSSDA